MLLISDQIFFLQNNLVSYSYTKLFLNQII